MKNNNIKMDFATVHNDDLSPHKSKSFSLSPPLRNFDQSIGESQPIKSINQISTNPVCGADDIQINKRKNLPSHDHLQTTTEVVSSTTNTISGDKEDTATAFEYPIDYSKKGSRLREILSMSYPRRSEETTLTQERVLNLSKEISDSSNFQYKSSSNSTPLFLLSNSPSLMTGKPVGGSSPSPQPHINFGQSFSPLMSQTVPGASMMIPLPYENLSPTLFSGHNFTTLGQKRPVPLPSLVPSPQLPALVQVSQNAKATRPLKAYPKDPLSLPPLGFYGLASSTTSGGTEKGTHQQTNEAYTDFRKRMLAVSNIGRCKRVAYGHDGNMARNCSSPFSLPSPSMSVSSPNGTDENSSDDGNMEMNEKTQVEKGVNQLKDDAYWERRRKNNLAAKRSRDARRAKEDEIAIRAAFLEQENLKLRFEVCALKSETAKLKCMLYS